jgi:hypothetical protein
VGASSSLFPGNDARKELDCWDDFKPQEEGMMNTAARFSLS